MGQVLPPSPALKDSSENTTRTGYFAAFQFFHFRSQAEIASAVFHKKCGDVRGKMLIKLPKKGLILEFSLRGRAKFCTEFVLAFSGLALI